jgi:hypothetical protein
VNLERKAVSINVLELLDAQSAVADPISIATPLPASATFRDRFNVSPKTL